MVKQIINLREIIGGLVDFIFGKPTKLEEIRYSGMVIPADYAGSVADYIAEQKGLIPPKMQSRSITKSSEVPIASVSIRGLREQLRQESGVKKDYFAKPVFRIYVPGRSETQLVTNSFCGSLDWR